MPPPPQAQAKCILQRGIRARLGHRNILRSGYVRRSPDAVKNNALGIFVLSTSTQCMHFVTRGKSVSAWAQRHSGDAPGVPTLRDRVSVRVLQVERCLRFSCRGNC